MPEGTSAAEVVALYREEAALAAAVIAGVRVLGVDEHVWRHSRRGDTQRNTS